MTTSIIWSRVLSQLLLLTIVIVSALIMHPTIFLPLIIMCLCMFAAGLRLLMMSTGMCASLRYLCYLLIFLCPFLISSYLGYRSRTVRAFVCERDRLHPSFSSGHSSLVRLDTAHGRLFVTLMLFYACFPNISFYIDFLMCRHSACPD